MRNRRQFMSYAAGGIVELATLRAKGDVSESPFEIRDIVLSGTLAKRFLLCIPRAVQAATPLPILVLLHGLGETIDERLGVYAWREKYGLDTAYARLKSAPLVNASNRQDWESGRIAEINLSLAANPFRGMAIVCPFTPNIYRAKRFAESLDVYATWITRDVLPRAASELGQSLDATRTAMDGCSLGGMMGLEVFLRQPDSFVAWGGVQSAIGESIAPSYAARIATLAARSQQLSKRAFHIETSSLDPFRKANERLANELAKRGVAHELRVGHGPHDQPWLREAGTAEMLLWHDKNFK